MMAAGAFSNPSDARAMGRFASAWIVTVVPLTASTSTRPPVSSVSPRPV